MAQNELSLPQWQAIYRDSNEPTVHITDSLLHKGLNPIDLGYANLRFATNIATKAADGYHAASRGRELEAGQLS